MITFFSFSLRIFPSISDDGIELLIVIIGKFNAKSSIIRLKLFKTESSINIAFYESIINKLINGGLGKSLINKFEDLFLETL